MSEDGTINIDKESVYMVTHGMEDSNLFAWYDKGNELRACRIAPNYLMLRKCKKPDSNFLVGDAVDSDAKSLRLAEGIMQHLTERPDINYADGWCSVLAVGEKREYSEEELDKYDIPKGYHCPAKPGDLVCVPESSKHGCHWRCGITGYDYDIVVAEFEPFLWFPQGDK